MSDFTMTIDGQSVAGDSGLGVVNPSTGSVFTEAPDCTATQLDAAMDSAERAFSSWKRDVEVRRNALVACADAMQAHAQELGQILCREQGKPLPKAIGEIMGAAFWVRHTATLEIPVEVLQDDEQARVEVRRRPFGVVGAITPWNFPIMLGIWKIAPALLAGNTVVIKPSPYTPLSTLKLGEVLREVLPPGVLNIVSGGDDLGAWITRHAAVRKISFTGSVATGKLVAAAAAPDLKRVTLELGGNDAAIVLDDVDPQRVAEKVFWGAFENSGQICSAIKRVYVPQDRYSGWVDAMVQIASRVSMGDGFAEGVELGPINNRPQFERVCELVEDARNNGANVASGGAPLDGDGFFFAPTIVSDIGDGTRLVDEEQFGPALPLIPYTRVEDAIASANGTHFGLSGSVWSNDTERATEIGAQLECGTAWINQHLAFLPNAPFGGAKWSGIGVENGHWGLTSFTELQTVNVAKLT
jgi:acyl-CoA reductase-like NAD-dependent aldehyde dehydrogenase